MTDGSRPLFKTLEEAVEASPDIHYRHFYGEIRSSGESSSSFAKLLSRRLDQFARLGIGVLHLHTTIIAEAGYQDERVAQMVLHIPRALLQQFEGGDTGYELELPVIERLIGFEPPSRS